MVSNIDKQARQRYEIPPIKIKHPYITRTSKLQQRSELLQRSKANLEDKGRDTMRVSKSCNILKPRRTTHRHFSTTSNLQSDASSQDRSQTNNVKLGFLAPPIRASIPVKRIGMDSDRILEIKKGGGRYREDRKANNGAQARSRIREVSLIFTGKNRMGKRRSFSCWNNLFRPASGRAKTKPPQMQPFAKYWVQYTCIEIHTHYSTRFIALQTSLSLQRLRYIDSRLKASKVHESKPRTRFSKSFPALVIVASYGIVLLARLSSSSTRFLPALT